MYLGKNFGRDLYIVFGLAVVGFCALIAGIVALAYWLFHG